MEKWNEYLFYLKALKKKKTILENRVHDITLKNACYCNFVVIDLIIVFVTVRASKNKYGGVFI